MENIFLACPACREKLPGVNWSRKQLDRNKQLAVFFVLSDIAAPDTFTLDDHCRWTLNRSKAQAYLCPESKKVWDKMNVGVDFLVKTSRTTIMYSEVPRLDIHARLAAIASSSQEPIRPLTGSAATAIPGRPTLPAGYRAECAEQHEIHIAEKTEANARHVKENIDIDRRNRIKIREIDARWGRKSVV